MQSCQLYMATTKHLQCYIVQGTVALPRAPGALSHEAVVLGAVVIFKFFLAVPDKACREHESTSLLSGVGGGWWSASGLLAHFVASLRSGQTGLLWNGCVVPGPRSCIKNDVRSCAGEVGY